MNNGTSKLLKQKVKLIIAREYLVIFSLLLLSGAAFFMNYWQYNQKKAYESDVQVIEPVIEGEKDEEHGGQYVIPQGIAFKFPQGTSIDIIKQSIKRDFPNIQGDRWFIIAAPEGKYIAASYDKNGIRIFNSIIYDINFSYVYIFFIFFAYPIYLLIRLTTWAIVTLIENHLSK